MLRKILITGGTGGIGRILVPHLLKRGMHIRLLALPGDVDGKNYIEKDVDVVFGDITDPVAISGLCDGIDTVIHMASVILSENPIIFDKVNVNGTRYLLTEANNAGVKHFIYISSASVVYRKMTPYSRSKRIAERYVRESSLSWTILRPTLVYGKQGGMEFDIFLNMLTKFPVIPVIGDGSARKRPVYVNDLVMGISTVAMKNTGEGKVYNLSGGSTITMFDFTQLCLTLLGREDRIIVRVPVPICKLCAHIMNRSMKKPLLTWNMIAGAIQHADLDPADAMHDFGYDPAPFESMVGTCFPRTDS